MTTVAEIGREICVSDGIRWRAIGLSHRTVELCGIDSVRLAVHVLRRDAERDGLDLTDATWWTEPLWMRET